MASLCYTAGRVEDAVRYCDDGKIVLGRNHDALPYGIEGGLGGAYIAVGQPERWAEVCRAELRRRDEAPLAIQAPLVLALAFAGRREEARVVAGMA